MIERFPEIFVRMTDKSMSNKVSPVLNGFQKFGFFILKEITCPFIYIKIKVVYIKYIYIKFMYLYKNQIYVFI